MPEPRAGFTAGADHLRLRNAKRAAPAATALFSFRPKGRHSGLSTRIVITARPRVADGQVRRTWFWLAPCWIIA